MVWKRTYVAEQQYSVLFLRSFQIPHGLLGGLMIDARHFQPVDVIKKSRCYGINENEFSLASSR
jgi:hypothetical protein